jgi:putative radical SAM enzyme (TIGR03279 family)
MAPRASYGASVPPVVGGGVLAGVEPGSPAARAGLRAGDLLVSADGTALRDIIDWQWASDGPAVEITRRRAETIDSLTLSREAGEAWGLEFSDAVFDGVRTCRNRCAFCFMTQLPKGLRRALYLRDDDYRLSFLQGNFVTLTNLSDADVTRIADQRLSPLYVSLHAVDADVRAELVCAREDRALERLDQLLDAGIDFHLQIVLVPGVNDGKVLERSLTWLAEREGILSVGIVPLGFTAHQARFSASYGEPEAAGAVIDQLAPWQTAFRERDGISWVYLADEFYLNAHRDVPSAEAYDGYPQYENGIGLVRSFLDDAASVKAALSAAASALPADLRAGFISGTLFAPVLETVLATLPATAHLRVIPAENRFFGGNVSVTGLLTACDLLATIGSAGEVDVVLVPSIVVNADGLLLDDVPAAELGKRSGRDVRLLSCTAGGLLAALEELAANPPTTHKE